MVRHKFYWLLASVSVLTMSACTVGQEYIVCDDAIEECGETLPPVVEE